MRSAGYMALVALTVLALLAVPVSCAESGTREADKAYYDKENNWFVMEFSTGLSGEYTCSVVSESADTVHDSSHIQFTGQKKIALTVDEGKTVSPGKYYVDMVKAGDHIFNTVTVSEDSEDQGDGGGTIDTGFYIAAGVAGAVVVLAAVLLIMRRR